MAPRDEGLDKLEAFIAAAAEARSALQRGGQTLERLREDVSELQDDAEQRLERFAEELEELIERAGPEVERLLPLVAVVAAGALFGPGGAINARLTAMAALKLGHDVRERLEELAAEWGPLAEELGDDLVSTIEEETREVDEAFQELMDGLEEDVDELAEDRDEALEAFQEPEEVLERGAEAQP